MNLQNVIDGSEPLHIFQSWDKVFFFQISYSNIVNTNSNPLECSLDIEIRNSGAELLQLFSKSSNFVTHYYQIERFSYKHQNH